MNNIPKASIKLLHINDDEEAFYCEECWKKVLAIKPLGENEEIELLPPETDQWCVFALTHKGWEE